MSGYDQVKFTIDGKQYRTTVLGALQGRSLYLRLLKAMAPALDKLDRSKLSSGGESLFFSMVSAALAELDVKLFEDLCDAFAEATAEILPKGEVPLAKELDMHFAKRYSALVKWVVECCKINGFLDFLSEIASRVTAGAAEK